MKTAEVNKYLKQNPDFGEKLLKLGFKKGPGEIWYFRERGKFLDVLDFIPTNSKRFMRVAVVCFKIDLVYHCDMSVFPKGFIKGMPNSQSSYLSSDKEGVIGPQTNWCIESEEDLPSMLALLGKEIARAADPWLKRIDNDKSFFYSFDLGSQEDGYASSIRDQLDF